MLADNPVVAFVPSSDLARSRAFYEGVLGMPVAGEDGFAVILRAPGATVRIARVAQVPPPVGTTLGWDVEDIAATVRALNARGVATARFPGMPLDELGVWAAPGGAKVAWFHDPDGNILSLTQRA